MILLHLFIKQIFDKDSSVEELGYHTQTLFLQFGLFNIIVKFFPYFMALFDHEVQKNVKVPHWYTIKIILQKLYPWKAFYSFRVMQIRQLCFFSLIGILTASSLYLVFLTATINLPLIFKLRFINFIVEHLLGIGMLIKRQYYCDEQDTCSHLKWMVGFTGINFLNFVAVEVYGMAKKVQQPPQIIVQSVGSNFIALSYCHLYFQVNIYLGVFCLFSMVMGVVFMINQRRHSQQMEQVLEQLETQKYQDNGKQENCSICLSEFTAADGIYKLVCGHLFHKQCLRDWFKQKLTCPMCRNNVGRPVEQHDSEFISEEFQSQQGEHQWNWQQNHPVNPRPGQNMGNGQYYHQQVPQYIRRALAQRQGYRTFQQNNIYAH